MITTNSRLASVAGQIAAGRRTSGAHWWFAAVVMLHTIRVSLDDALKALHPADAVPYGTNRLHDGADAATTALRVWDRGSIEFASFLRSHADGRHLGKLHTLAELLYTGLISALLLALVVWITRRLSPTEHRLQRGVMRWSRLLTGLYFLLGILDQVAEVILLSSPNMSAPDSKLGGGYRFLASLLQFSSLGRRLVLICLLAPIVLGLLAVARSRHGASFLRGASPYRVMIALVAVYAVVLNLGTTGEQALDAIRLWIDAPYHLAIVAVATVAWFSSSIFAIARRIGYAVTGDPDGDEIAGFIPFSATSADPGPVTRKLLAVGAGLGLVGLGAQLLVDRFGGIGVLGGLLFTIGVLSELLEFMARRADANAARTPPTVAVGPATADAALPGATTGSIPHEGLAGPTTVAATRGTGGRLDSGASSAADPTPPTGLDLTAPTGLAEADVARAAADLSDARARAQQLLHGERTAARTLPSVLGYLPYVVLTRAVIQAAIPEAISPNGDMVLLLVAAAIFVGSGLLYRRARQPDFFARTIGPNQHTRLFRRYVGISAGVMVGLIVWVWLHVWSVAAVFGVHGLLGAFLAGLTVAIGLASYATESMALPSALRVLGLRRWPIVMMIAVWAIVASLLPGRYHDVRVVGPDTEPGLIGGALTPEPAITATAAFQTWVSRNIVPVDPAAPPPAAGTRPAVPMVFVAAQGGGIRAASFTATALDCLIVRLDAQACASTVGEPQWNRVMALSGASGGSVGIASTSAEWAAAAAGDVAPAWVAERLGGDMLSPSLAWQLFLETPNTLLHAEFGQDRAEVLERSWERRWDGVAGDPATAVALTAAADAPLMLLNGTNVHDSCRVNTSRLDGSDPIVGAAPTRAELDCRRQRFDEPSGGAIATSTLAVNRDVVDYLCPFENLRLSTAAFLSARFPFVSPTGTLRSAPDRDVACMRGDLPELSIGDGGYRDNTGASAIIELWAEIEPLVASHNRTADTCIVPVLIEIDNGHRNLNAFSEPGRARQLLAPLSGAASVFGSRDAGWIEAAANEFSRPLGAGVTPLVGGQPVNDRFARVSLYSHPGVQAPLGWSLSPAAVADITGQLSVRQNQDAINEVSAWFTAGNLACTIA